MNWYKKIASKVFIGNCITGLNDPLFQNALQIYDATDLAQLVEKGKKISKEQFLSMCFVEDSILQQINQNPNNFIFYYDNLDDIAWIYNINKDIEYFYF